MVVVAAAIAAACTLTSGDPVQQGQGLHYDSVPSESFEAGADAPPSGASAAPGIGADPGAHPLGQTSSAPRPPSPAAPVVITKTVEVPPPHVVVVPPMPPAPSPTHGAPPPPPRPAPKPTASPSPTTTATPAPPTSPPTDAPPTDDAAGAQAPTTTTTIVTTAPDVPIYTSAASPNCAVAKCIALTFSGGPGSATRQFLQVLSAHSAKGTFFVTGEQVAQNADVVAAIAGSGNEVANGTWSQADLTTLSAADQESELQQTDDAVRSATGIEPTLFRPMGGHTAPDVVAAGKREGLTQVLWDLDTQDYSYQNDAGAIAAAIERAKPGQIVMLHDTFPTSATGLDEALTALSQKGYVFVTVSELLGTRTGTRTAQ